LGAGERKDVTIRLAPGAGVTGVVRWEDGTPAPGVRVHGKPRASGRQPFAFDLSSGPVRTDVEGRFAIGPFVDNDVVLVVENKNQRVAEPGAVVTGRVVEGATGAPLPGAGPKVRLLVGGVKDVHQHQRLEVAVPALGAEIDLGTIRLERVIGL
jgi:hypothetical protein